MPTRLHQLVLAIAIAVPAVSAQKAITPGNVDSLRHVTNAVISPDGTHVAFGLTARRDPSRGSDVELWVVPCDGSAPPRAYVSGQVVVASIGWTPDSKKILFTARRQGQKAMTLHAIALDGGEARPLFEPAASIRTWSLSHDGKRVAYTCTAPPDPEREKWRKRGFAPIVYEENVRGVDLHLVDLESGTDSVLPMEGAPFEIAFSPDDSRLALWVAPTPSVDDSYMMKRLHVYDIAEKSLRQIANNPGKVGNFAWSPNGKHIAFVSAADIHDPRESTLMVVPAAGGAMRVLTAPDFEGHVLHVEWRDDDTLLFMTAEGCVVKLVTQSRNGGLHKTMIDGDVPVWTSFSIAKDRSRIALVGDRWNHPGEVFVGQLGATPRRLTHHNGWLDNVAMGKQEVVRYPARDGLEIEGVLIWPVDYREGERYPLILCVHGGPESHYSNGWLTAYSRPGQMAAAKGYFVFYQNYRASTGRGVAFSKLDQGRLAKEEFDDLVDGVDWLIERGLVDEKRVGVTGGSYGGYASAWCATRYSHRFAASVMFVGISNQISKRGCTDIPNEDYLVHWRLHTWDDNWQKVLEASPIYYVKNAKTPILIAHGQEDPRVSVTQSRELHRMLKTKGDVPVRLVLYPGEGHGNRKTANRLDYCVRMMRWFDWFLGGRHDGMPPWPIDYGSVE